MRSRVWKQREDGVSRLPDDTVSTCRSLLVLLLRPPPDTEIHDVLLAILTCTAGLFSCTAAMQSETNTKIAIRGKGSVKEGANKVRHSAPSCICIRLLALCTSCSLVTVHATVCPLHIET